MNKMLTEICFWLCCIFCVQDIYLKQYLWAGLMLACAVANYYTLHGVTSATSINK